MVQKSQETEGNEDLRVRRTRKLLMQALIDLTIENGFAAITVRDITERAMVNRSTFYRHYLDKYDLLEQYLNEVYELTAEDPALAPKSGQLTAETAPGPINLLRHIQTLAEFYRVMLGPKGDPVFTQRLRQNTERRFRILLATQVASPEMSALPIELRLNYISSAGVGAIHWCLENGQPCTPEQLSRWLSQLSFASAGLAPRPDSKP